MVHTKWQYHSHAASEEENIVATRTPVNFSAPLIFSFPRGSRKFQSSGHTTLITDRPYIMPSLHPAVASRSRCANLSFNRGEELAALVVSS